MKIVIDSIIIVINMGGGAFVHESRGVKKVKVSGYTVVSNQGESCDPVIPEQRGFTVLYFKLPQTD